jgi:mannan endo-1,4-beta-mannosidase
MAGAGVVTGGGGAGGTAVLAGHKFGANEAVRILVIGSSNEIGTCWRAFLWRKLRAAGLANIDFVGGVSQGPDCGVAGYDKDMQGENSNIVSNWTATDIAGWFTTNKPDIVLLHVGGADALQSLPVSGITKNYSVALDQARLVTPDVEFMNAQHTPMTRAVEETKALNAAIVAWAAEHTTTESPITPVDLYTGLSPDVDTRDGTHLNDIGAEKVADRFFMALQPLFAP